MPALELPSRQRRRLRALAHRLEPVVRMGHEGLTDGVVEAVKRALLDHELIKVRMRQPDDKDGTARALADASDSALCGLVGHVAILYRPHPDAPRIALD